MTPRVARYLFSAYLAALVSGCLSPFAFVDTAEELAGKVRSIKWIPFRDPRTGGLHSPVDTIGNVGLFLPLGALGRLAIGESRRLGNPVAAVAISGLWVSVVLETLQLLVRRRVTNVTDVIANGLGCLLGALAADWWQRHASRREPP